MNLLKKLFPYRWVQSVEDKDIEYFEVFNIRHIYREGKHMGWYRP